MISHLSAAEGRKLGLAEKPKRNKFGNNRASLDGKTFDSEAERDRYAVLMQMQRAGLISGLRTQPQYHLHAPSGEAIGRYIADFEYVENGVLTTEDVKGFATDLFLWKKRHFEAEYGRKLKVTK